jgi:hypothetical protein
MLARLPGKRHQKIVTQLDQICAPRLTTAEEAMTAQIGGSASVLPDPFHHTA